MRELFGAIVLAMLLATPTPSQSLAEPRQPTAEQWREDLRFLVRELETRHANLHHQVSRERFAAAVDQLDSQISGLSRNQVIVGMMRIAAMVGDGHTRIEPRKDPAFQFPSLPLKLYLFDDGVFVRAAKPDHRALIGARVEAVGGIPVDEAIRRVAGLASRDNSIGPRLYVPLYLAMPDILQAMGLAARRDSAVLTVVKDGRRWTVAVPVGEVEPRWPADTDISLITPPGWIDANESAPPMWLEAPLDSHRLIDLPARKALYAQLNMVTDIAGQTLDQFGEKILARSLTANPRAILLDLRLNQGGNGMLRTGLVRSLIKAEDHDTRLYILTRRGTFSASQFILNDLEQLTAALLVGEPASSRPTHYGDSYRSILPHSGITLRTSIVYWKHEQDERPWNAIDIAVPYRFADYAAARDPVVEAALSEQPPPPLESRFEAAARRPASAAAAAFDSIVADPINRYADIEEAALNAAYELSGAPEGGRQALELARWAAAKFPASANSVTVLALIAEQHGSPDEALRAARKALQLDKNNRTARSVLERLSQ